MISIFLTPPGISEHSGAKQRSLRPRPPQAKAEARQAGRAAVPPLLSFATPPSPREAYAVLARGGLSLLCSYNFLQKDALVRNQFTGQVGTTGCKQRLTSFFSASCQTHSQIRLSPLWVDLGPVRGHHQSLWSLPDNQMSFIRFVGTVLFSIM